MHCWPSPLWSWAYTPNNTQFGWRQVPASLPKAARSLWAGDWLWIWWQLYTCRLPRNLSSGCQQDRDSLSHDLACNASSQTAQRDGFRTSYELFSKEQTVIPSGKLLMGTVCLHNVELTSCRYSDKANFLSSEEIEANRKIQAVDFSYQICDERTFKWLISSFRNRMGEK